MGAITVKNTGEVLDFNDLQVFSHEDGWNGGKWSHPVSLFAHNENYFYFVNKENTSDIFELKVTRTVIVHGSDNDHGHVYNWTRNEPVALLKTDIGGLEVEVLFSDLLKKGTIYIEPIK